MGQLPQVTASAIDYNIDIICIQERRYIQDIKYNDTSNGWTQATASRCKSSVNATIVGMDMLIRPRPLKSLMIIEKIQSRTMVATFNGNPSAAIISYSPTNDREETELIAFCDELSSLLRDIPNTTFSSLVETNLAFTTRQTEMNI